MRRVCFLLVTLLGLGGCATTGGTPAPAPRKSPTLTPAKLAIAACQRLDSVKYPAPYKTDVAGRLLDVATAERAHRTADANRLSDALMTDCLTEYRLRSEAARLVDAVKAQQAKIDAKDQQTFKQLVISADYDAVVSCAEGLLQGRSAACRPTGAATTTATTTAPPTATTTAPPTAAPVATKPTPPAPTPPTPRKSIDDDDGRDDDGRDAPSGTTRRGKDGLRFRGGISAIGGGMFVAGWELGMVGIDGRLGVQINDLIGVYLEPHLTLGGGSRNGIVGLTGVLGAAAMVDFTFLDTYVLGVGMGGAILNNPAAGELHFKLGTYLFTARGANGVRRKALALGVDLRTYFVGGYTVVSVLGGIGYEAF